MSEQSKSEWLDDTSFADLNDDTNFEASDMDIPEDSFADMDNLPSIESLADDELLEMCEDAAAPDPAQDMAEAEADIELAEAPAPAPQKKSPKGIPVGGLSTLFVFALLVAGVGMAGALLFALDADPVKLWAPEGLLQVDQILNFTDHPLNLFYLVTVATVLLAVLGGGALIRSLKRADARVRNADELLARVSELSLDDVKAWQDPVFKSDPALANFVTETVGAYRMLDSRLKRQIGFEGELRRLEKAISDNSRTDLAGRYEHPTIGTIADGVLAYYDAHQQTLAEVENVRKKDRHDAESVVDIIQDARGWHRATHDQVGVQGAALERIAGKVTDLAGEIANAASAQADTRDQQQLVAALRSGLTQLQQAANGDSRGAVAELSGLVDQGNKLAFQIAMEVARLGSRGERLLPMTQSLEELTTNFREVTGRLQGDDEDSAQTAMVVEKLRGHIEQIDQQLTSGADERWRNYATQAAEIGPAAGQVATNLTGIARGFNNQADRLVKLGQAVSELASVPFDASEQAAGNPDNPPEGNLRISQHDPFGKGREIEPETTEVDPFASADRLLDGDGSDVQDLGFTTTNEPGSEEAFQVSDPSGQPEVSDQIELPQQPEPSIQLDEVGPLDPVIDLDPPSQSQPTDSPVSSEDERVYDLAEFGAVRIDEPADGETTDTVFDLNEFGAVSLT